MLEHVEHDYEEHDIAERERETERPSRGMGKDSWMQRTDRQTCRQTNRENNTV